MFRTLAIVGEGFFFEATNMSVELWERLERTPELLAAIAESSGSDLAVQAKLRSQFDADLVRLGLTLARLRSQATSKFKLAERMWFDAVRLEQATGEIVARHKAKRFSGDVVDLCAGLGADSIALADRSQVHAVDSDPLCEFFVTRNADVHGVSNRLATSVEGAVLPSSDCLVHIDPDRRVGDRRVRRLEEYSPPLEFLQQLAESGRGGAIKVSSAANFGGKFVDCEIELVSLNGECKEATVWFGELAGTAPWRATALPSAESISGDPLDAVAEIVAPQEYIFDPDPALVRSGLIDVFCDQVGIARLDDAEEYLTSRDVVESDFVTPFRVLDRAANNEKQIRRMLKDADLATLEVKARHVPVDANALQRKFSSKLSGSRPGVLFIARLQGKTTALLAERV